MATIPTFRTWTAGEIVTAAFMNTNIRDAGNFFLSWPVAELRQGAAQSLGTSGTGAAILFDTEDIDTDNGHSTVTNTSRYTAVTAGRYQFSGGVGYASNATGIRMAYWCLGGTTINGSTQELPAVSGFVTRVAAVTITQPMNGTTDFVELFGLQTSGGALSTDNGGGGQPRMSVRMVGTT